jgi:uncharacterized protein YjiS (DUF1127 family)
MLRRLNDLEMKEQAMTVSPIEFSATRNELSAGSWAMTLARAISRAFSRFGRERRIRSDIGALMTFDDSLLKDIGISRSDIEYVVRYGRRR